MIIWTLGQKKDLAKRSLVQVIEVVNKVIRSSKVIIAYCLPGSNIILIFEGKVIEFIKDTI